MEKSATAGRFDPLQSTKKVEPPGAVTFLEAPPARSAPQSRSEADFARREAPAERGSRSAVYRRAPVQIDASGVDGRGRLTTTIAGGARTGVGPYRAVRRQGPPRVVAWALRRARFGNVATSEQKPAIEPDVLGWLACHGWLQAGAGGWLAWLAGAGLAGLRLAAQGHDAIVRCTWSFQSSQGLSCGRYNSQIGCKDIGAAIPAGI